MKLLLDTHVLLWWDEGKALDIKAQAAIREADLVYVSAVAAWEVAIKRSTGKLKSRRSVADAVIESGFEELPVRFHHADALAELPWHHRDPFDRMLVAQAITEGLTLVTRDPVFREYKVRLLRA